MSQGGNVPTVHERDEWLDGYLVAAGEGSAWWGGNTWPGNNAITNITWHYPGGLVDQDGWDDIFQPEDAAAGIRRMQAQYHRRSKESPNQATNGRPAPFSYGYDLGYQGSIDLDGGIWKIRWTDKRCAANGGAANGFSFAMQFMVAGLNDDLTPAQVRSARWLDRELRGLFPNIPAGVAGHKGHRNFFSTACPGDVIYGRHVVTGDLLWQDVPTPPPDPIVEADMPDLFKSNDAIHWPGSPTLPGGDYPPNNGHVFVVEVGGAVRHVPAAEFAVYLAAPTAPVKVISGANLKGMLDANGVYKAQVGGGAGAFDRQATIEAVAAVFADEGIKLTGHFERA